MTNSLVTLVLSIEHEHNSFADDKNQYIVIVEGGCDEATTRSGLLWRAANTAPTDLIYQKMVRRWMKHAMEHPNNSHVQAVRKLINDYMGQGQLPDDAVKMAFFRPVRKKLGKKLLEMRVMGLYQELKEEHPLDCDKVLFTRISRRLQNKRVTTVKADNIKKIWQRAKGRYIF
jgi:hypothetical protein